MYWYPYGPYTQMVRGVALHASNMQIQQDTRNIVYYATKFISLDIEQISCENIIIVAPFIILPHPVTLKVDQSLTIITKEVLNAGSLFVALESEFGVGKIYVDCHEKTLLGSLARNESQQGSKWDCISRCLKGMCLLLDDRDEEIQSAQSLQSPFFDIADIIYSYEQSLLIRLTDVDRHIISDSNIFGAKDFNWLMGAYDASNQ